MRFLRDLLLVAVIAAASLLAPRATAGTWGPEVRLTTAYGYSLAPQVATWNGTVHAVWFDYVGAQADAEILYARSVDNGATWSAPVNLSSNASRIDVHPSIAADASGVYVLWGSDVMTGELYFRRSHDNGVSWRAEQQLTSGPGYSRAGALAIDAAGILHAAFYDDRAGYSNVYHKQSCDHGATWTVDQNVTAHTGVVDNESPRLSTAADGTLYLAYRSSLGGAYGGGWPPYQIYLLRGTPAACPGNPAWFYPAQRVTRGLPDEHSDAHSPEIVAGASGYAHVAFWDRLAGTDLAYRRLDPARGFGPVQRVGGFGPNQPTVGSTNSEAGNLGIAEDSVRGLHLLYAQNAGADGAVTYGRLFYRGSADAGATFGTREQVGTTTMAATPKLAYGRGRVHAVWSDFRDNNVGSEIYYRSRDTGPFDLTLHYYNTILGRWPDGTGYANWTFELARVQGLGIDARQLYFLMAAQFFGSAEYAQRNRDDAAFLGDLYMTFYGRTPDAPGLAWWQNQLASGASREMVRQGFANSAEAQAFHRVVLDDTRGRAGDTFVSEMYWIVLNRMPDWLYPAWRDNMRAAACAGPSAVLAQAVGLANAFFDSAEYAARNRDDWAYVRDLYMGLFKRYEAPNWMWVWGYHLHAGTYTRQSLRSIYLGSAEFAQRVNQIVQEGCLP